MHPIPESFAESNEIHPTAIIDKQATLGRNIKVGPYCIIGKNVVIHDNVTLHSHVVLEGKTTIGEGTVIFPFSSIGHESQDFKPNTEKSSIIIGKNNTIREYVTIQPGTEGDMKTVVGDNCLLMVSAHVAHDCVLGNNIVLANHVTLAGHVTIDDYAILGGLVAVHQYVCIGTHAMIGGMSGVEKDVIPYGLVFGDRAKLKGINFVGLKRHNFSKDEVHALFKIYNKFFLEKEDISVVEEFVKSKYGKSLVTDILLDFLYSHQNKKRPLCQA